MKKNLLAVGVMALMLAASSCSGNNAANNSQAAENNSNAAAGSDFATTTNIRYVDLDSIGEHYNLAKEIQEFSIRTYGELDQAQRTKSAEIQKFGTAIQEKMQNNGYLSEASYNADMQKFNKMQADAQNALATLQRKAEQELLVKNQQLNDSIQSFITDYNKSKHYDAILYKAAGVYFNPALDITAEVIEGLNKRYPAPAK